MYNHPMIPKSLKTWFVIHFLLDIIFGLPLLLIPTAAANFLGFEIIQTLPLRLVGAALIGIGSTSIIKRDANIDSYKSLLTLKIIWSFSAIIGILLSILESPLLIFWGMLTIFVIFNVVWVYYYLRIKT